MPKADDGRFPRRLSDRTWQLALPIPGSPLGVTLTYAFLSDDGPVLIDLGWHDEGTWDTLVHQLQVIGLTPEGVAAVLLTHFHPDHAGLASRFRASSNARIALAAPDQALIGGGAPDRKADILARMNDFARCAGAPPITDEETADFTIDGIVPGAAFPMTEDLVEGSPVAGLSVLRTPGHTPGHAVVDLPGEGLVLLGDHLLPRITPNISSYAFDGTDALDSYFRSLERVALLAGKRRAFPAHEGEIHDLAARIDAVRRHHERRLAELESILSEAGWSTAWELAGLLSWSSSWKDLKEQPMRRAAVGETVAHAAFLVSHGRAAVENRGGIRRWGSV